MTEVLDWLWEAPQPWVVRALLVDLLDRERGDPSVEDAHRAMLEHAIVRSLIEDVLADPWPPLTNHKQAKHPLHKLALLADLGLSASDPQGRMLADRVLQQQAEEGAFRVRITMPRAFGGSGEPEWMWMGCDAPVLLHALLAMGLGHDERVQRAAAFLASQVADVGWPCTSSTGVRGPGRKADPCPYATLVALRALAICGNHRDSEAARLGAEAILRHWQHRTERKIYLFGIGTDFGKLKYPFVWYDLLHVLEVLSRFPWVHRDPRFLEKLQRMNDKADGGGRYRPESVWMAFKGFDFTQKREPSPMLTVAALRIQRRVQQSRD